MVVAFAPIVALLLGLSAITVPWATLLLSVVLYIVMPVIVAQLWRRALLARGGGRRWSDPARACGRSRSWRCWRRWCCCSASRASRSSRQPLVILLLAVPILIQVYFNAGLAYCSTASSAWRTASRRPRR